MKTTARPRLRLRSMTAQLLHPSLPSSTTPGFDPDLPEDGALIIAEVLRDQLNALNDAIATKASQAELNAEVAALECSIASCAPYSWVVNAINASAVNTVATVLPQTSSNSNAVALFDQSVPSYYDPYFQQGMVDKMNELITTLRR